MAIPDKSTEAVTCVSVERVIGVFSVRHKTTSRARNEDRDPNHLQVEPRFGVSQGEKTLPTAHKVILVILSRNDFTLQYLICRTGDSG